MTSQASVGIRLAHRSHGLIRMIVRCVLLSAITASVASVLAAPAEGYLYWSTGENTIARAANDGTDVNLNFIGGAFEPLGVAVDSNHVYWINGSNGSIGRANLDGTNVDQEFITGGEHIDFVAVDGAHIYWTSGGSGLGHASIGRAELNGANVNQHFIALTYEPTGLAVNGEHIFWGESYNPILNEPYETIEEASLDGTGKHTLLKLSSDPARGLAVDASHIYWAGSNGAGSNTIGRANLNGTNVIQQFVTATSVPVGVAVEGEYLYWVNSQSFGATCGPSLGGSGSLGRSLISGANAEMDWQRCGGRGPYGLAVDALAPPATPPPPPAPTCCTPPPVVAPVISNATQSASRWREGNKLAQISRGRKPPVGTTFKFSLNTSASVSFAFTQAKSGRNVAGKCVAQTGRNRKKRKCTQSVVAGMLGITGHAGVNTVGFQGRLTSSKKLKPGLYTLLITATTPGAPSTSKSLTFTITK
jgi:virginiamycin B lyase